MTVVLWLIAVQVFAIIAFKIVKWSLLGMWWVLYGLLLWPFVAAVHLIGNSHGRCRR